MRLVWAVAAHALAWAAVAGSLYLSLGMGLKACPLCFYQRAFVMAAAGVLAAALLAGRGFSRLAMMLAVPAAAAGFGVACWHVFLEATGRLECPAGIFGVGSAPQQALAVQALLLAALLGGVLKGQGGEVGTWTVFPAALLGLAFAYGAVISTPPPTPTAEKDKDTKPDVCRPPYRPAS